MRHTSTGKMRMRTLSTNDWGHRLIRTTLAMQRYTTMIAPMRKLCGSCEHPIWNHRTTKMSQTVRREQRYSNDVWAMCGRRNSSWKTAARKRLLSEGDRHVANVSYLMQVVGRSFSSKTVMSESCTVSPLVIPRDALHVRLQIDA